MESADWGMTTNIEKVFNLILDTAVSNNSPQEDIPEFLFIISDMEFDRCEGRGSNFHLYKDTLFNVLKNRFEACGYKIPTLIFWNVDARNNQSPMVADENGWVAVSGFSPSIFKAVLNGIIIEEEPGVIRTKEEVNPIEVMMKTLYSDRYAEVKF